MSTPLQDFDKQQAIRLESNFIVGIDEAGRGPLAGPVVACACFIPPALAAEFSDVNDSKKLTEKKREAIYKRLAESEVAYGIGFASAAEIDQLNILQATFLAMRRASQKFIKSFYKRDFFHNLHTYCTTKYLCFWKRRSFNLNYPICTPSFIS